MEFEETNEEFFKRMERKINKKEKMSPEEILRVVKGFLGYIKKKDFKRLNYYQVQEIKKLPAQIDIAIQKIK